MPQFRFVVYLSMAIYRPLEQKILKSLDTILCSFVQILLRAYLRNHGTIPYPQKVSRKVINRVKINLSLIISRLIGKNG